MFQAKGALFQGSFCSASQQSLFGNDVHAQKQPPAGLFGSPTALSEAFQRAWGHRFQRRFEVYRGVALRRTCTSHTTVHVKSAPDTLFRGSLRRF